MLHQVQTWRVMCTDACGKRIVYNHACNYINVDYLTIRLRARVFYEQIVNEAQPSWLSLVENEGE